MKCWYCGKGTMEKAPELGSGWFQCSNCSATWVDTPPLAPSPLGEIWRDGSGERHYSSHYIRRELKS